MTSRITVSPSITLSEVAVDVSISHTRIGDLVVALISPNGTSVVLHNRTGGNGDNIRRTSACRSSLPATTRPASGSCAWPTSAAARLEV